MSGIGQLTKLFNFFRSHRRIGLAVPCNCHVAGNNYARSNRRAAFLAFWRSFTQYFVRDARSLSENTTLEQVNGQLLEKF